MDIKFKLYPHPVLWNANDDYMQSTFDCIMNQQREVKKFSINLKFELDDVELKKLIENGMAEYLIHVEAPLSSYRVVKTSKNSEFNIILKDENVIGKVNLCPFLIAKNDIQNYKNKNFNQDYENIKFNMCKGSILAIGTQQSFKVEKDEDELSNVPSIFTIYKKETNDDMPMEIEVNDSKIRIGLNIKDYENYYLNVNSKTATVNAFVILPSLIYAFERLKESFEDYIDCRWVQSLIKMMKKNSIDLNQDLVSTMTSIELAQQIMNLPVSTALYELREIGSED